MVGVWQTAWWHLADGWTINAIPAIHKYSYGLWEPPEGGEAYCLTPTLGSRSWFACAGDDVKLVRKPWEHHPTDVEPQYSARDLPHGQSGDGVHGCATNDCSREEPPEIAFQLLGLGHESPQALAGIDDDIAQD